MIRLLIATTEESRWRAAAARLRGVALDVSPTFEAHEAYHAVVFPGPQPIDVRDVEPVLRAGKHVLYAAEPTWGGECEWLWAVADGSGAQLAIVNPDRHRPSRQLIKQLLPDKLGQIGLIRMHRWEIAKGPPTPAPLPGPLLRDLDMALWLSGRLPDCVYALEHGSNENNENSAARGRFLQVHLGCPGGGMALIDYDSRLPDGDGYQALSVIGSTGAAYADEHQNMQLVFRGGRPQAVRTNEGVKQDIDLIQSFADGLRGGHDLTQNAAGWRDVHTVAVAVCESLTSGQAVRLEGR